MDSINLPSYVWILLVATVVLIIILFIFILNRRAKEGRELDAMFQPAWEEGDYEEVDREEIQKRRREGRARWQEKARQQKDRMHATMTERGTETPNKESLKQTNVKEESSKKKELAPDEGVEGFGSSLSRSSSRSESGLSDEKIEKKELKEDANFDRLGSLPPLGIPRSGDPLEEKGMDQEHERERSFPSQSTSEISDTATEEEASPTDSHFERKEMPYRRLSSISRNEIPEKSNNEQDRFQRLGGLPPLDTSFSKDKVSMKKPEEEDTSEDMGLERKRMHPLRRLPSIERGPVRKSGLEDQEKLNSFDPSLSSGTPLSEGIARSETKEEQDTEDMGLERKRMHPLRRSPSIERDPARKRGLEDQGKLDPFDPSPPQSTSLSEGISRSEETSGERVLERQRLHPFRRSSSTGRGQVTPKSGLGQGELDRFDPSTSSSSTPFSMGAAQKEAQVGKDPVGDSGLDEKKVPPLQSSLSLSGDDAEEERGKEPFDFSSKPTRQSPRTDNETDNNEQRTESRMQRSYEQSTESEESSRSDTRSFTPRRERQKSKRKFPWGKK